MTFHSDHHPSNNSPAKQLIPNPHHSGPFFITKENSFKPAIMHFLPSLIVLLGASAVTAMSIVERKASNELQGETKVLPNLHVLMKGIDGSYNHSEEMADQIRARSGTTSLEKRTTAKVLSCYGGDCSNCHEVRVISPQ
jgi:hypothetical protein